MEKIDNPHIFAIRRLGRFLQTERKLIYLILFYALANGIIVLTLPLGIQAILNFILGGRVSSSWVILIIVVMAGLVLSGLVQIAQLKLTEQLQQRIFAKSSFEFAARIPRIKLEAIQNRYAPEMVNQFFDTVTLQKTISKLLVDYPTASLQVLFGLILISIYHPFFLIFSLGVMLLLYIVFRLSGPRGVATSIRESSSKYQVAHWLEELARTMGTFKLAGVTNLPLVRIDQLILRYLDFRRKHFSILLTQYKVMVAFKVIVIVTLLIMGSLLLIEDEISIGQFVAAEIVIILIMNSIEKLILGLETVYDMLTSFEKLGAVTDMPLESSKANKPISLPAQHGFELQVDHLKFRYPGTNRMVLNEVSFHLKPGQKVAICGPPGSGKSTLLQLLVGLYEDFDGRIFYNGFSLNSLRHDLLRLEIGDNIWQENIFKGTVRENLTMGKTEISDESAIEALHIAGVREEMTLLDQGLDTDLFPGGVKLPRSLSRKIILARSILGDTRMVLLELETEMLKQYQKHEFYDHLFAQEFTVIAATRDEEFMERSDAVWYLKQGRLVFTGDYESFKNSEYAESIR